MILRLSLFLVMVIKTKGDLHSSYEVVSVMYICVMYVYTRHVILLTVSKSHVIQS